MTHDADEWPDARSQVIATALNRILHPGASATATPSEWRRVDATSVDSLAMLELVAVLEAETGRRLDDTILGEFDFRNTTLEQLVLALAAAMRPSTEA